MTDDTETEITRAHAFALLPESDAEREIRTLYWEAAYMFGAFAGLLALLQVFR